MRARMISIGDGGAIDDIVARVVIVGIVVRVAFRWGEAGAGIDKPGRSRGVARLIDLVAIQGGPCFARTCVAFVAFVAFVVGVAWSIDCSCHKVAGWCRIGPYRYRSILDMRSAMQPMRRESPYPMVPIEEAQRIIAAHVAPLGVEEISSLAADGRVLAEDVFAGKDIPDVPKAAVDGYALRAGDGMAERRVLAELTAGGAFHETTLSPGTAARIMTGAPLPPGADAVIMVEQTEEYDGVLRIERSLAPGESIHTVGQDIARGALVLSRGAILGAAEIGLLATIGRGRARVYRRPVVAVLATGDEVPEPDAPLSAGGIRDSNRYALMAAAPQARCEAIPPGLPRDDKARP